VPRLAHRRVTLFFWPTRASSADFYRLAVERFFSRDCLQTRGETLWNGPPLPPGEIVLPENQTEERMMKIAVLGIDLGKNVCRVVGLDSSGVVVLRRRVRRDTLIDLVAKLPSCIVGMEGCCGAHHLGRLQLRDTTFG
jgi:hypothetical protein